MADEQTQSASDLTADDKTNINNLTRAHEAGMFVLPDNFESVEAFWRSHKELRAHATRISQENAELRKQAPTNKPAENKPAETSSTKPVVEDMGAALKGTPTPGAVKDGKINWQAIQSEITEQGDLSEETRQAAKTAGAPDYILDTMVRAHKQELAQAAKEAADLVGGPQQLKELLAWAKENLSPEDRTSTAAALSSPSWKLAIMGLARLRESADPRKNEPKTTVDGKPSPTNTKLQPFASQAEMTAAITNPKYHTDPAYRKEVEDRILLSRGLVHARRVGTVQVR